MTFSVYNSKNQLLIILPTIIAVRNYIRKMTITLDDELYSICNSVK